MPEGKKALKIPYEGFAYLPHQEEGVRWLISREDRRTEHFHSTTFISSGSDLEVSPTRFRGGILADDMGLGKTWQLIGLILNTKIARTLLVVPASLIQTWLEALAKAHISSYTKPKTQSVAWSRNNRGHHKRKVYIISYERFVNCSRHGTLYKEDAFPWGRIVCDEAQAIRNGDKTIRYASLAKIEFDGPRWLLTGTPFQNKTKDLLNLFSWIAADEIKKEELAVLVHDCMLRRTYQSLRDKGFAGIPPPYNHEAIQCEPATSEEHQLLDKLLGNIEWGKKHKVPPFERLEMFLRMNQAMAHPKVYHDSMRAKNESFEHKWQDWTGKPSGKLVQLEKLLGEQEAEPTIVFCSFTEEIDIVARKMRENGYKAYKINGSVGFAKRQETITEGKKAVENGNQKIAYIIQWVAGGAGLNLQFCSRIILYSQNWNPAVIQQAIGRAHRIGQTKQVRVFSICFAFEDELNMDRRMKGKQEEKIAEARRISASLLEEDAVRENAETHE